MANLKAWSLRLNALVKRRDRTQWSEKEQKSLRKLIPPGVDFPEEDFELLRRFYELPASTFPLGLDKQPKDFRRHDLCTILNNWPGEVDKANKHFASSTPKDHYDN